MENRMEKFEQIHRRIERVRRLYSRIGEPLAADVIIDLYLHLEKGLEAAQTQAPAPGHKQPKMKS